MRTVALRLPRRNPKPLPVPRARAPPTPPIALILLPLQSIGPASQDLKLLLLFLASHLASKKMEKLKLFGSDTSTSFPEVQSAEAEEGSGRRR